MRQCWNRQTGTFEGRVSLTYGFKSRLPHQVRGFAKAKPLSFLLKLSLGKKELEQKRKPFMGILISIKPEQPKPAPVFLYMRRVIPRLAAFLSFFD